MVGILDCFFYIIAGLSIGILSSFFGFGGSFIITPFLNILGMPIITAVGTSITTSMGISLLGVLQHFRTNNVLIRLSFIIAAISILGASLSQLVLYKLKQMNLADVSVVIGYITVLTSLSFIMLSEYFVSDRNVELEKKGSILRNILSRALNRPPLFRINLTMSYSIWVLLLIGLTIGFLQGFLGIGGGFVLVPIFVYVLRLPANNAVGCSLPAVFTSSAFVGLIHILQGNVRFVPVILMIFGAIGGTYIGMRNSCSISDTLTKLLLAGVLFTAGFSMALYSLGFTIMSQTLMISITFGISIFLTIHWLKYHMSLIKKHQTD